MTWLPTDNGHYAVWKNYLKCQINARLAYGHSQCSADTTVWPQSVFSRHYSMATVYCNMATVSVQQTLQYGQSVFSKHCSMATVSVQQTLQHGHSILQYGHSQCSADTAVWPVSVHQILQYGHSILQYGQSVFSRHCSMASQC